MQIRPIETSYNGHRFRSRLEARWAVFFDEVMIEYQYELEGYVLPHGERYLPDFFLPGLSLDVEVKPHRDLSLADIAKLVGFAGDADKPLLLLVGTPGGHEAFLLDRCSLGSAWEYAAGEDTPEQDARAEFWGSVGDWGAVDLSVDPQTSRVCLRYRQLPPNDDSIFMRAFCAAKSARFEHVEAPRGRR